MIIIIFCSVSTPHVVQFALVSMKAFRVRVRQAVLKDHRRETDAADINM